MTCISRFRYVRTKSQQNEFPLERIFNMLRITDSSVKGSKTSVQLLMTPISRMAEHGRVANLYHRGGHNGWHISTVISARGYQRLTLLQTLRPKFLTVICRSATTVRNVLCLCRWPGDPVLVTRRFLWPQREHGTLCRCPCKQLHHS